MSKLSLSNSASVRGQAGRAACFLSFSGKPLGWRQLCRDVATSSNPLPA